MSPVPWQRHWMHKRHPITRPHGWAMECLLWIFEEKWSCYKEVWLNKESSSRGKIRNNIRLRIPQGHHFTQQAVTVYTCNFLFIWQWCRVPQHQLWLCCKSGESNKEMIFRLKLGCNHLRNGNIIKTVCTVVSPESRRPFWLPSSNQRQQMRYHQCPPNLENLCDYHWLWTGSIWIIFSEVTPMKLSEMNQ